MDRTFQLEILTYEKKCLNLQVRSIIIPAYKGLWGIKKGHANSICLIKPGIIEIEDEKNDKVRYVIGEGVCRITPLKVVLLVRSFEKREEIDKERLKQSIEKIAKKMKNLEDYSEKERIKITNAFLRNQARKKFAYQ